VICPIVRHGLASEEMFPGVATPIGLASETALHAWRHVLSNVGFPSGPTSRGVAKPAWDVRRADYKIANISSHPAFD